MTGAECASNGGGGIEGSPISTDSERREGEFALQRMGRSEGEVPSQITTCAELLITRSGEGWWEGVLHR